MANICSLCFIENPLLAVEEKRRRAVKTFFSPQGFGFTNQKIPHLVLFYDMHFGAIADRTFDCYIHNLMEFLKKDQNVDEKFARKHLFFSFFRRNTPPKKLHVILKKGHKIGFLLIAVCTDHKSVLIWPINLD